jgi:hypothetical protein
LAEKSMKRVIYEIDMGILFQVKTGNKEYLQKNN